MWLRAHTRVGSVRSSSGTGNCTAAAALSDQAQEKTLQAAAKSEGERDPGRKMAWPPFSLFQIAGKLANGNYIQERAVQSLHSASGNTSIPKICHS